ncbi:flagellar protein FliT [Pseudomonas luteola]|uniref:Flagellar protein FliT n=1 Tax=Pseudomonas luteola TaxID=47886 RepID=A0ABS0MK04_PSELU|nr:MULTISPECIES: flagellar protein FliT [Pseudomonas]MBA1247946.1 flagellar protein FliT [Pseudomonas zeshuii]MBH3437064.1 flagellar protein FliT [Pseudomonas luteola]QEU29462.1 flagellar protein FliT [Pseudomonas luteola]
MSLALQRLDETRDALAVALECQDWDSIGPLDFACRTYVDEAMREIPRDDDALRLSLEKLLAFYGKLIYASRMQRNEIAKEASKAKRSQKAANVYKLFG